MFLKCLTDKIISSGAKIEMPLNFRAICAKIMIPLLKTRYRTKSLLLEGSSTPLTHFRIFNGNAENLDQTGHLEQVGILEPKNFYQVFGSSLKDKIFIDVVEESPKRVAGEIIRRSMAL